MSDISSIDPSNAGSVIATIPVDRPVPIAFDSSNGDLYVATYCCEQIVSIISGQTNTVIGNPIPVGKSPIAIAFDSGNGDIYVANAENSTVSAISGQTNTVIGNSIAVGLGPQGIAFDSSNGNLYVTNAGSNSVSVIATTASQQPPHTNISSVIDDNNIPVRNGSTTVSTSIHITFTGQAGTNPIAGFLCSLDGSKFSSCTSPFVASNLAAGKQHTFQVIAVDTLGNKDPTPAHFSWTVLTPTQGIEQLIQLIKSMNLDHGLQTSLIASLNAALGSLNHNNHISACNQLSAFVNKVHAKVSSGRLSTADALQLIQSAQAIHNALGCK